jgi:hypothetical protein
MSKAIVRHRRRSMARRHRRARRNPKHSMTPWIVGGVVVAGLGVGGYFIWRYMAQQITVAPSQSYSVPAGTITVTFPNGSSAAAITQGTPPTQLSAATAGTTGTTLTFTGTAGQTYTATWSDSNNLAQTASIAVTS